MVGVAAKTILATAIDGPGTSPDFKLLTTIVARTVDTTQLSRCVSTILFESIVMNSLRWVV